MKRILFSVLALVAVSGYAQQKKAVEQSGSPAIMSVRDKQVKAFLQRMEGGKLTFQPFKQVRDITVPGDKITRIQFVVKFDEDALKAAFDAAEYDAALAIAEPLMAENAQYMEIDNNLRPVFTMMFESYWGKGDYAKVREYTEIMSKIGDEEAQTAQVALAMAKIDAADYEGAKAIADSLDNKAAQLYLEACALRARDEYIAAFKVSNSIIKDHAFDLEWLERTEFLNAQLYLDMTGGTSVIQTNSAINTARQVKNMHRGSNTAGEATIFWKSLGGEAIEKAEKEERARVAAEKKKREEEAEAERKRLAAERKAQREAERRAAAEAEAAAAEAEAAAVDTTTE